MRYLLILMLFISCGSEKKLIKDKTETKTEVIDSGEIEIKRPSDTLELTIPKIIYKDTTIYKRGRKSIVYLNYDSKGNAKVISVCDSIAIFKKWYKKTKEEEDRNIKEKDKSININPLSIIYVFIGLLLLIFGVKLMNKFI